MFCNSNGVAISSTLVCSFHEYRAYGSPSNSAFLSFLMRAHYLNCKEGFLLGSVLGRSEHFTTKCSQRIRPNWRCKNLILLVMYKVKLFVRKKRRLCDKLSSLVCTRHLSKLPDSITFFEQPSQISSGQVCNPTVHDTSLYH